MTGQSRSDYRAVCFVDMPLAKANLASGEIRGFETDLRDYYPGVNAVNLMARYRANIDG
jgi:hypothetical protein